MKTKKAGSVLINLENKEIGLVYRAALNDYSFPKGHLEEGESLKECAVRETIEETGRNCSILDENVLDVLYYTTPRGEDVEKHMYLTKDLGPYNEEIPEELKESLVWVKIDEVENKLSYEDLKEFWNKIKDKVKEY